MTVQASNKSPARRQSSSVGEILRDKLGDKEFGKLLDRMYALARITPVPKRK